MQLEITDEEAAALRTALESYLSDLRVEIGDTDRLAFRERLKANADLLGGLLRRLGAGDGVSTDT